MTDLLELEPRPENLEDFALMYANKVREISKSLHRKYGTIEAEDIEQGIWEAVVRTFDSAFKGLDPETARSRLYRVGVRYQDSEDIDYMYFSGNYSYSPKEVRVKLSTCAWTELDECPDIDAKVDLNAAFDALPPKRRMALFKRYGMKVPASEMSSAENRACERGVESITVWLNRADDTRVLRLDEEIDLEEAEEFLHESYHGSENGGEFR